MKDKHNDKAENIIKQLQSKGVIKIDDGDPPIVTYKEHQFFKSDFEHRVLDTFDIPDEEVKNSDYLKSPFKGLFYCSLLSISIDSSVSLMAIDF